MTESPQGSSTRQPHALLAVISVMTLCAASVASAGQALSSTEVLARTIRPGDAIFLTDRTGSEINGRLLRISPDALTLAISGQERVVPATIIGRVERRDPLWNGPLIVGAYLAQFGAMVGGFNCSGTCANDVLLGTGFFAGIGAGLGLLGDWLIHGRGHVTGVPLGSPQGTEKRPPISALGDLWMRVRQGDTVTVFTSNGRRQHGRFVRITPDRLVLESGGVRQEIEPGDVTRVTRTGNRYRSGAIAGAVFAGVLGTLSSAACGGTANACGEPIAVGLFMASAGTLWGMGIGALVPKHPTVFGSEAQTSLVFVPIVDQARAGLQLQLTF
jgi:hypothetical protein